MGSAEYGEANLLDQWYQSVLGGDAKEPSAERWADRVFELADFGQRESDSWTLVGSERQGLYDCKQKSKD